MLRALHAQSALRDASPAVQWQRGGMPRAPEHVHMHACMLACFRQACLEAAVVPLTVMVLDGGFCEKGHNPDCTAVLPKQRKWQ